MYPGPGVGGPQRPTTTSGCAGMCGWIHRGALDDQLRAHSAGRAGSCRQPSACWERLQTEGARSRGCATKPRRKRTRPSNGVWSNDDIWPREDGPVVGGRASHDRPRTRSRTDGPEGRQPSHGASAHMACPGKVATLVPRAGAWRLHRAGGVAFLRRGGQPLAAGISWDRNPCLRAKQ